MSCPSCRVATSIAQAEGCFTRVIALGGRRLTPDIEVGIGLSTLGTPWRVALVNVVSSMRYRPCHRASKGLLHACHRAGRPSASRLMQRLERQCLALPMREPCYVSRAAVPRNATASRLA
ncbi:hypothetical protein HAX54_038746 [Datura stramonium]|uniref:Uncharacterized protein n=1 Tax=Datura stramonium TaxID=4076 RepID=A0ABS8SI92_DATST|nr:hypothetical protein [Datura stramonium]